jgi:hypothetical protein
VEKLEQSVLLGYIGPSGEMVTTYNGVQPHFEGLTLGPCMAGASGASEGQVPQGKTK